MKNQSLGSTTRSCLIGGLLLIVFAVLLTASPAQAQTTGTERARLTWDTATDIDLHVWDGVGNHASYMDPEGIPDATLSLDDTTGYGPEFIVDSDATGRSFTFGACYYDGDEPTNVRLVVTDPNGSQRTLNASLSAPGDGRVMAVSPSNGVAYDPPDDDCIYTGLTQPPVDTAGCPPGYYEEFARYHRVKFPGVNQSIFQYYLSVPHCKGHPGITEKMMTSNPPTAGGQILPSSWAQLFLTRAASVYLPSIEYEYAGGDLDMGHPAQVTRGANSEFIVSSSKSFKACTSLPATKVLKIASKSRILKVIISKVGKRVSYKEFVNKISRKWRGRIVGWLLKPVLLPLSDKTEEAIKKHIVNQIEDYVDGNFSACKTVWEPNMTAAVYPDGSREMSEPSKPSLGLKSYSSDEPATER